MDEDEIENNVEEEDDAAVEVESTESAGEVSTVASKRSTAAKQLSLIHISEAESEKWRAKIEINK
ncbi:hypothetical protein T4E_8628 [Trichinella pseudospiralis]|uniref:Uncharacterized protein n=1 Tax=Trichinella pseudospiralis TaxID=6337 RepID=A0A0V0WW78_TRIPS|nr:hypothetical protein T4E_8628 [Trichinella pseudospiralis]